MARVVHICPRYAPARGGVESFFRRLSEHLASRGHNVEVWTARAVPGSLPLEPHSIAHVVAIDGATAVVEYRPAHAGEIPGGEGE